MNTSNLTLREAIESTRQDLGQAEDDAARITERIRELREELRGLELALRRRSASEEPDRPATDPDFDEWQALGRSQAVERVLRESGTPLSPLEILKQLQANGRTDDIEPYVSAALSYLKRTGRAWRVSRGQWVGAGPNSNLVERARKAVAQISEVS